MEGKKIIRSDRLNRNLFNLGYFIEIRVIS